MNGRLARYCLWSAGLLLLPLLVGYVGVGFLIGRQVWSAVAEARSRHDGEPIEALIAVAGGPGESLADRNHAIWALGQVGASEALPVLRSLVTNAPCVHDRCVCQRKVAKAIALCSGSPNFSAWMWRGCVLAAR